MIFDAIGLMLLVLVDLKMILIIIIEGCYRLLILIEVWHDSIFLIVGIQVLRHHCIRIIMIILGRFCDLVAVA